MYAVIRTGGKQYRVKPGDVLEVEHLSGRDESVSFLPLLVVTDDGQALHGQAAAGYAVGARLLGDAKGEKIIIFKYKNKTGYSSKTGHRQLYSTIEITSIGEDDHAGQPDAELDGQPAGEIASGQ